MQQFFCDLLHGFCVRRRDDLVVPAARLFGAVPKHLVQRELSFRQLLVPQLTLLYRDRVGAPRLWRRGTLRTGRGDYVEHGAALAELIADIAAAERRWTFTPETHDDD